MKNSIQIGIVDAVYKRRSICPITCNIQTKMLKSSFESQCKAHRAALISTVKVFLGKSYKPCRKSCEECAVGDLVEKGELVDPPVNVEWITVEDYEKQKRAEVARQQAVAKTKKQQRMMEQQQPIVIRVEDTQKIKTKTKAKTTRPRSKLTPDMIREIRAKYAEGNYTHKQLSMLFGTTRRNIGRIINRDTWKHIK